MRENRPELLSLIYVRGGIAAHYMRQIDILGRLRPGHFVDDWREDTAVHYARTAATAAIFYLETQQ